MGTNDFLFYYNCYVKNKALKLQQNITWGSYRSVYHIILCIYLYMYVNTLKPHIRTCDAYKHCTWKLKKKSYTTKIKQRRRRYSINWIATWNVERGCCGAIVLYTPLGLSFEVNNINGMKIIKFRFSPWWLCELSNYCTN